MKVLSHRQPASRAAARTRRILSAGTALPLLLIGSSVGAQAIVEQSSGDILVDADSASGAPVAVELATEAVRAALADTGADVAAVAEAIEVFAGLRQFEICTPFADPALGASDNYVRSVAGRVGANPARAQAPGTPADARSPSEPPVTETLFRDVRVFDGKSTRLSSPSDVLVRGNRIAAVGTHARVRRPSSSMARGAR